MERRRKAAGSRSLGWIVLFTGSALVAAACGDSGAGTNSSGGTSSGGESTPEQTSALGFARPSTGGPVPAAISAACSPDKSAMVKTIKDRGTLNWATGIAPPFTQRDNSGQLTGIEPDNAAQFAHFLGVNNVNIKDYDYNLLPPAVTSGQADIIGAELFFNDQRAAVINYSTFYFKAGQFFLVLENSKWKTLDDLNSPDNRFIHEVGGGQVVLAKKVIPKAPITLVPKGGVVLVGYQYMKQGQNDSTAMEGHLWPVLKKQYPDLAAIGTHGRITSTTNFESEEFEGFDIGFGVAKSSDPGWINCVNAFVKYTLDSGVMTKRINYWSSLLGENVAK
jgi:ABC-type amino acid transport substrate-binding protein